MPNPYDLIIGSIHIGGHTAVEKYKDKFQLIVNCSPAVACPTKPECLYFPVANSTSHVQKYFDLIIKSNVLERMRQCVQQKKPVLVNCTEGMHRSCTMVACYLIKHEKMNVDQAMKFIKSKRSIAFNPVYQLKEVINLFYAHIQKNNKPKDTPSKPKDTPSKPKDTPPTKPKDTPPKPKDTKT